MSTVTPAEALMTVDNLFNGIVVTGVRNPELVALYATIGGQILSGTFLCVGFFLCWSFCRSMCWLFRFLRDCLFPPKDASGPDSDGGAPDDEPGE